jgi:hypothetical protein
VTRDIIIIIIWEIHVDPHKYKARKSNVFFVLSRFRSPLAIYVPRATDWGSLAYLLSKWQ